MKKFLSTVLSLTIVITIITSNVAMAAVKEYTEDELNALNLKTSVNAFTSDTCEAMPSSADRLKSTPKKYLFKIADSSDDKEYILLKSVNAGENDGIFVMSNDSTDDNSITPYNTAENNVKFDAEDQNCIAYKINQDSYINSYFPLMKDYINMHTWYTEPGFNMGVTSTNSKIAILSLTEYVNNSDRIGISTKKGSAWFVRTQYPKMSSKSTLRVYQFINATKKIDAGSETNSLYNQRMNRPCFYLNEDFFANYKIDEEYLTDDAQITGIVKKLDLDTLKSLGYSDNLLVKWGLLKGGTEISNVTIDGEPQVGCKLSAKYDMVGLGEEEKYTKIKWEWSDNATDGFEPIEKDSDQKEYVISNSLNEKYIRYSITLGNSDGMGQTYYSEVKFIKNLAPVVGNVKISGSFCTNEELTVSYDTLSGTADSEKTIVNWYWYDSKDGQPNLISDASGNTYVVSKQLGGKFIGVSVTPANSFGIKGECVSSDGIFYIIGDVNEEELETPFSVLQSVDTLIEETGTNILDTVTPEKYTFTIDRTCKTKEGIIDSNRYILLKSVNAKKDDGYFIMLDKGAVSTSIPLSASYALRNAYPGKYLGTDENMISKNYQAPTRNFNSNNDKSIAYYLNNEQYVKERLPIMYDGNYINDHVWYTEPTTADPIEKAYSTDCKIALISTTEYVKNIERIGTRVEGTGGSVTIFGTRSPHPSKLTGKHTGSSFETPAVLYIRSDKGIYGETVVYYYLTLERPCFYISKDFFKNVKINISQDSVLADVLKENLSYPEMKKLGYTDEELTKSCISTDYPIATNANINGIYSCGNTVYADFDYSHTAANIKEKNTKYQWYIEENGDFRKLDGETDYKYVLKDSDIGKKVKVEITPCDELGYIGEKTFATSFSKILPKANLTFSNVSIGDITQMNDITNINAKITIESKISMQANLYVGVFNKKTNRCVDLSVPSNLNLSVGSDTYYVSTNNFNASNDNYIKLFVFDSNNKPLFGTEYFKR